MTEPGLTAPVAVTEPLAGVTRRVQQVLGSVTELAAAMSTVAGQARRSGPRGAMRRADLAALRPLVAGVLRRHQDFAAGAGVVLAPGVLADAPRWIDWWWADQGAGISRLEVDLDPASAEFYDYTTTEWYRQPARTGRTWVAGPYVDYICTHKYTFTASAPVMHEGRFLGVAGADILASQVERLALPELARMGRPAVLVSGGGRVIASNTTGLLPGMIAPAPGRNGQQSWPAGLTPGALPWVVLAGNP